MWADKSVFYHIYPIGFCGAPLCNDFNAAPQFRLSKLYDWLPHLHSLGINAIYLGPIFESDSHGYDTKDYFQIDRRLGSAEDFKLLVQKLHSEGIRIVLDAVFNHVGRNFWAFEDVRLHKSNSHYCSWFRLNFDQNNHYNDGFCYEGWDGCDNLVKLNLTNPEVKAYLLSAVAQWIDEFDIDGLRLDVAHYLNSGFLHELHQMCKSRKSDFWLMGEMVFGNYCRLVNSRMLNSCTNYELYKALHSSCNDTNMFELSYTLGRQFAAGGVYEGLQLYSFLDNHDVSRIATKLKNQSQLKPLYGLLFTLPGIPSIYYGSEWGATGDRDRNDSEVRPEFILPQHSDLGSHIAWWAQYRRQSDVLAFGSYKELYVSSSMLCFRREHNSQALEIAVNISPEPQTAYLKGQEIVVPPYEIILL